MVFTQSTNPKNVTFVLRFLMHTSSPTKSNLQFCPNLHKGIEILQRTGSKMSTTYPFLFSTSKHPTKHESNQSQEWIAWERKDTYHMKYNGSRGTHLSLVGGPVLGTGVSFPIAVQLKIVHWWSIFFISGAPLLVFLVGIYITASRKVLGSRWVDRLSWNSCTGFWPIRSGIWGGIIIGLLCIEKTAPATPCPSHCVLMSRFMQIWL